VFRLTALYLRGFRGSLTTCRRLVLAETGVLVMLFGSPQHGIEAMAPCRSWP
jgi:hypothetical protein